MRRFSMAALVVAATTTAGACSLLNAPADVIPGSGGAGGAAPSSSTSSTGTSGTCVVGSDCAGLTDVCGTGVCTNGMCTKMADASKEGVACDDGLFCTIDDICKAGTCSGATKPCANPNGSGGGGGTGGGATGSSATGSGGGTGGGGPKTDGCHVLACVEASKQCELVVGEPGSACEDGDPCTSGETCSAAGVCGNSVMTDCSSYTSECSVGECKPGEGCSAKPLNEGAPCDTANFCAESACLTGKCTLVAPKNVGVACDDKVFCTSGEKCQSNGGCSNGTPTCVTANKCQNAQCDEDAQTCSFPAVPTGQPCEDGDACTGGETCNVSALCVGGTTPPVGYFFDDFSSSNKGWILGPEWQIGGAKESTGGSLGADPAADHSASGDNGVAGVVLGGNEQAVPHAPYYIESPSVNVAAAGKVILTYYRWLNSDYTPYMRNMIEVYDGTSWKEIWTSEGPPGIQDSPPVGQGWKFMSHDVTAYKNPSLKVRFGYEILLNDAFVIGSWNLDDVKIQNTPCPNLP